MHNHNAGGRSPLCARTTRVSSVHACHNKKPETMVKITRRDIFTLGIVLLYSKPSAAVEERVITTDRESESESHLAVDLKRKQNRFKRDYEGRVAFQNKQTDEWVDVKCDLQAPGLLLLRDPSDQVFYVAYASLKQVDLSDDDVVSLLAMDGWESFMMPIRSPGVDGGVESLKLSREEFYKVVTVVPAAAE